MTDWSYETCDPVVEDRASLSRKIFVRTVPALAAFSFSAAVALRLAGGLAGQAAAPEPKPEKFAVGAPAPVAAVPNVELASGPIKPDLEKPRNPFGGLFDPAGEARGMPAMQEARTDPVGPSFSPLQAQPLFVLVETPDSAAQVAEADMDQQVAEASPAQDVDRAAELKPGLPPVQMAQAPEDEQPSLAQAAGSAPLPPIRPAELISVARVAAVEAPRREIAAPATPAAPGPTRAAAREGAQAAQTATFAHNDPRSFFDKLFSNSSEQKGPQLAYAAPESGSGLFNLSRGFPSSPQPPASARGGTAVYDISAHTVYLPNGTALEAHSGLGPYFDDPGHVHVRMRGATPPATYKLTLRESLFHGVQALRLTPVDGNVYGRAGLLAHTFMLGARGDSNGCVSFRNYRAFLDAYVRGEVRELKVVASR